MNKIFLLFNTIKYLKFSQIYYRIINKFKRNSTNYSKQKKSINRPVSWVHLLLHKEKINSQLEANFLNLSKKLCLPNDWNNQDLSKLWLYNLHYFEDLLSNNADSKKLLHIDLLYKWVKQNHIGHGNGWEPYPISLRVVNILKAWMGGLDLDQKIIDSVFIQSQFLFNNLEKHLLGNHYFVNLKAVFFSGIVFDQKKWIEFSQRELINQINEQILDDGAHFELSPMYHNLILIDVLDIYNLSQAYPQMVSTPLKMKLKKIIPVMLKFMEKMSHPDGGVSFFNDSVNGIAPSKIIIEKYAESLGFEVVKMNSNQLLTESGYMVGIIGKNKLIFDAANICPDYMPGHAHADSLSFELSINNQRVFVNSGISKYGTDKKRVYQRKTRAHNTIEINSKDSSEVWGGFRVGNRAKIIKRNANLSMNNRFVFSASHNGYKHLLGGCIHERIIEFGSNELIVCDLIKGNYTSADIYYHFHPSLNVLILKNQLEVRSNKFILTSDLGNLNAELLSKEWFPEFGISIPNKVLKISMKKKDIKLKFQWRDIA